MVVYWALLCADGAHAQLAEPELKSERFSLAGGLGYFNDSQAASTLDVATWRIAGAYAFDERFALAVDAGWVILGSSPERGDGDLAWRPGNPAVLGLVRGQWGTAYYQLGVGGTVPLSTIDRDAGGRLQHAALNHASGMSGLWEAWLWAPDRSALLLRARLDAPVVDKTWLSVRVEPTLFIPARSAWGREEVDVFLPVSFSLGARHRFVWFGAFAQAVLMPTRDPDGDQLAAGPWLRVVLGSAFVQARALINLDEPLAGTRGPGIWGLHLEAGGTL